ncbi:hypothetical protein QAD02_002956 [Eretmocerus hayati]|uniref:Uncharacterized protein n=1 Tax=Eretmocerus hayati TaxID=131215 RepID=A0ACC2NN91_9HYME|nr:hypothetical protein QAD02_002956 [Eretmocerus hayati]
MVSSSLSVDPTKLFVIGEQIEILKPAFPYPTNSSLLEEYCIRKRSDGSLVKFSLSDMQGKYCSFEIFKMPWEEKELYAMSDALTEDELEVMRFYIVKVLDGGDSWQKVELFVVPSTFVSFRVENDPATNDSETKQKNAKEPLEERSLPLKKDEVLVKELKSVANRKKLLRQEKKAGLGTVLKPLSEAVQNMVQSKMLPVAPAHVTKIGNANSLVAARTLKENRIVFNESNHKEDSAGPRDELVQFGAEDIQNVPSNSPLEAMLSDATSVEEILSRSLSKVHQSKSDAMSLLFLRTKVILLLSSLNNVTFSWQLVQTSKLVS